MLSILVSLFLLISSAPFFNAHADDFNIIGDSNFNLYKQTISISRGAIVPLIQDSFQIDYDSNLIAGITTQEILESVSIEDLTEMNYWKRIPDIADSVNGPPGTPIDIVYHFSNKAGHSVDVSKVVIPFSKENPEEGNWLNVTLVNDPLPVQRGISMLWDNRNLTKSGLLKEYIGPGVLEDAQEDSYVLDTLVISNPIQVVDIQSEEVEDGVKMLVTIENIGNEILENIHFEHLTFSQNLIISPSQKIDIEYILEEVEDLGQFQIENPNEQTECVIYGIQKYQWVQTKGITVLAFREDGGWVNGSYVIPEQESFCISRIPYTMISPVLEYEKSSDNDNMEEQEKEQGQEEKIEDFLDDQEVLEEESEINNEQGEVLGVIDESGQNDISTGGDDEVSKNNFVLPKTGVVK